MADAVILFDTKDGAQALFDSSLFGDIFLTIFGTIYHQLADVAFIIELFRNPFICILLSVTLAIEFNGDCNGF